jgi:hypothetical protein
MAVQVEIPARDWTFEINNGTEGVPDWIEVAAINTWSHSPSANDADTQTFDDNGRMRHMKMSRGDEFTLSGLYKEDPDNGNRDAGQEACEAWAALTGAASLKQFRITSPGGTVKTFLATAVVTSGGGGNDDPSAWECTVTVSGAITTS